jgi:hypothetical protein
MSASLAYITASELLGCARSPTRYSWPTSCPTCPSEAVRGGDGHTPFAPRAGRYGPALGAARLPLKLCARFDRALSYDCRINRRMLYLTGSSEDSDD